MPSVSRKNNSELQTKPLKARLYSLNNNLIKGVKQPQTSIFVSKKQLQASNDPLLKKVYQRQMDFGYTTPAKPLQDKETKKKFSIAHKTLKLKRRLNDIAQNEMKQISQQELERSK